MKKENLDKHYIQDYYTLNYTYKMEKTLKYFKFKILVGHFEITATVICSFPSLEIFVKHCSSSVKTNMMKKF